MSRYRLVLLLACLVLLPARASDVVFSEVSYSGDDGGPAPGPTQYRNPILAGFYPDPSAIRVGDDFYLVNSSFGYFPGLPIFHSRDLVSWRQIGNAIDRNGQLDYGQRDELTRGLFAPAINHHRGTFYLVNTCFYCDGGNYLITATHPAGPWSEPIWLGFSGIDPSLFFDGDGRAWIVNNDVPQGALRYDGHRAIWLQEFDPLQAKMVGPRTVLVDGGADPASKPEHIEGPHLFKHDGWYYLTAAEGGTGKQHAQMIWRSRQVNGPYLPGPDNPVLTQRDLDPARPNPVTSSGHAQFIQLKDGSWWSVFLATRPYRGNQYNLGRETFLLPVSWKDGWPQILARGERIPMQVERPPLPRDPAAPATSGPMQWSEHFRGEQLPPQWLTLHPPSQTWFSTGPNGLTLTPATTALGAFASQAGQPAYLARRLQHHHATLIATLAPWQAEVGELAGLALIQNERHHYVLAVERDPAGMAVSLYLRAGQADPVLGKRLARIPLPASDQAISLRFELQGPRLDAAYSVHANQWQSIAKDLDASLLSVETAGGFIGNTFGPYALRRQPD